MCAFFKTFASYVPRLISRHVATDLDSITQPWVERSQAAVLLADISGFTPLTESFMQRGLVGAEEISRLLNDYFGKLIELITAHGGDIVKIVGDSLLAFWPAVDEELPMVVCRASQCGLALQSAFNNYEVADGVHLSMKVGVGAGEGFAASIGGLHGCWTFLVAGAPFTQMAALNEQLQSGDIVLSPEVWELVGDYYVGRLLMDGHVRLTSLNKTLSPRPLPALTLSPDSEAALRVYVPNMVLSRIDVEQTEWLSELRRVTALFINLTCLDYTASNVLDQLQDAMQVVQHILHRYEGSFVQIQTDEKGTAVVAAFGLPPLTHEDDVIRGVKAAIAMQSEFHQLRLHTSIGITTGQVFCGPIGNATRREYTIYGDVVNLAARLMQAAQEDEVLCDVTTYDGAHTELMFDKLPPFVLKGKMSPVPVYRAIGEVRTTSITHPMIGRQTEKAILTERLQALQNGIGGIVLIEGEAGIGKTRLVEDLLQAAQRLDLRYLVGAGDSIEKSTPYQAWRSVFNQLFGLDTFPNPKAKYAHVLAELQDEPKLLRLAPLLDAVLPLDIPDNEITSQMMGQVRAENIHEILVRLLQKKTTQEPLLLILDDAHWLDSASWALALRVSRDVHSLFLTVTTRPLANPFPPEYIQLRDDSGTQHLLLNVLSAPESSALVCQRLGAPRVSEPVVSLIHDRAEGNPFFMEEIAYALRDSGLVVIADGECQIPSDVGDLDALVLPDTVQGVITSRIDQLTPSQQLTLKAASVIGPTFTFDVLESIYPIESDKPQLREHLNVLDRLGILALDRLEPNLTYSFRHIITQEIAYNLMLFAQRRQLHCSAAEWYERIYADELSPFYTILAHHWSKAEDTSKAIDYLEKAGQDALRHFANEEGIEFFEQVLALDAETDTNNDKMRRAHWELQLGEAYVNQSKYSEGGEHLEAGLALLELQVPNRRVSQMLKLVCQISKQILFRLFPERYLGRQSDQGVTLLAGSGAYAKLAEVYYYANQVTLSLYAALRSLNLAESAGLSPELARGYAAVGALTGLIPLRKVAESYCRRALDVAHMVNDLSAHTFVSMAVGYYYIGVGNWVKARKLFEQIVEISERLGDERRWEDGIDNLMDVCCFLGDFVSGAELADKLYTSASNRNDVHYQSRSLHGKSSCLLHLGKFDEAMNCLDELQTLLTEDSEIRNEALMIGMHGLLAIIHLRRSEYQQSVEQANQAENLPAESFLNDYVPFCGYAGVAEVYLTSWGSQYPQPGIDRLAQKACKKLHRYARVSLIVKPRAWLCQGTYYWLSNKPSKARKAWAKSLATAEQLGMAYEQACAHYEIGRHLPNSAPNRKEHLNSAVKIFTQLGAAYNLKCIQEALAM